MSFSDMFKKTDDLTGRKCFSLDKSITVKTKTSEGVTLEGSSKIGKGLNLKGKYKGRNVDLTKVQLNSDGHFDFESECADFLVDNVTFTQAFTVGSSEWGAKKKNNESCVLGARFSGVKDLDAGFSLDFTGSALNADACYKYQGFSFGAEAELTLPFALGADSTPEFSVGAVNAGVNYAAADYEIGLSIADVAGEKGQVLGLNVFHNASDDFKWAAVVSQKQGDKEKVAFKDRGVQGRIVAETKLDNESTATMGVDCCAIFQGKFEQVVSNSLTMTYQMKMSLADIGGDAELGVGIKISA